MIAPVSMKTQDLAPGNFDDVAGFEAGLEPGASLGVVWAGNFLNLVFSHCVHPCSFLPKRR